MHKAALLHSRETSRETGVCQEERERVRVRVRVRVRGEGSWGCVSLGSAAGDEKINRQLTQSLENEGQIFFWVIFLSKVTNEL